MNSGFIDKILVGKEIFKSVLLLWRYEKYDPNL